MAERIKVAIAGSLETDTGQRSSTLAGQIGQMGNMEIACIYNQDKGISAKILEESGLENKKNILTDKFKDLANIESDVLLVTETRTEVAAEIVFKALLEKKNVVNMNAASEALLGPLFKRFADMGNIIYSVGAGDEPAVTLSLINYCRRLGLEVVCAGKGKNNPLDIYAAPSDFGQKSKQLGVSREGITSFVDGTKTMLEMAILSNASGIPIDTGGMHGPNINLSELEAAFRLKEDGGLLDRVPVIDYVIGDVAPGVFTVFTTAQEHIIRELDYLKMGKGPNYLLYTPYHLGNIESPLSIYDVAVDNKATLTVKGGIITMVCARAKKDIGKGDRLDRIGGYCFSGIALDWEKNMDKGYIPLAMAENGVAGREIKKGQVIRAEDMVTHKDSYLYTLYNMQQKMNY